MENLLREIRKCEICKEFLPYHPNPVVRASSASRILVVGQAPGQKVQDSGIPWDDASGNNLRRWLGVDKEVFYNPEIFALIPMGFCFPGTGKSGDLPPRKECGQLWHPPLLDSMKKIELTLLIGSYAQNYYLKGVKRRTLTETVLHFEEYLPKYLPLPHPSPRNNIWFKKNSWFEENLIPVLQEKVRSLII